MDRKLITTFIVIYGLAAGAGFVYGETDTASDLSVATEEAAPDAVRSESMKAAAPDYRPADAEMGDIVQLPMIIVRPEASEEEAVEES